MADEVLSEETWNVDCQAGVFAARQRARELGLQHGLDARSAEAVTIAVSELANNIVHHAGRGQLVMRVARNAARRVLIVVAYDEGPGIADIDWALTDGCSSSGSMGCGLPAVRRLMDEFHIDSRLGLGTVITVKKWLEEPKATLQPRTDGNARS